MCMYCVVVGSGCGLEVGWLQDQLVVMVGGCWYAVRTDCSYLALSLHGSQKRFN